MKQRLVSVFCIIVMALSFTCPSLRISSCLSGSPQLPPFIYVEPNNIHIPENAGGHQFTINVSIWRAMNVYAFDLRLYYNSALLNGTSVAEGSFLKSSGGTFFDLREFNDEHNSTSGCLNVTCTLLGPELGVNGTGTLVTVTFQTKPANGSSILDISSIETTLCARSDSSAKLIFFQAVDGTVCLGTPSQIRVPSDYSTIQQAINAATIDSTILVANGTYFENLIVNKTVSLIGENKSSTVIDANNSTIALLVNSNSVSITGFTIQNASSHAILFDNSSFTETYDNAIENCRNGLCYNNSIQNNVTGNLITGNTQDGIQLFGTATVANNTIKSNGGYGLNINFSSANIFGNMLESNEYGICLSYSGGSTLRKNSVHNNTRNFSVDGEELSDYLQDIDDSNTANEKTIRYLTSQRDLTINQDTFSDIGYLGIINSTNIRVTNLNLTDNGDGILVAFTQDSTIENVSLEGNFIGVKCIGCQNDNITQVAAEDDSIGVKLSDCSNVEIHESCFANTVPNLGITGVEMINCDNAILTGNTLIGYSFAFQLCNSSGNTSYHNNIINNSVPVSAENSFSNMWDNGYQGNYWSSYNGTDNNHDGIRDTPYLLDVDQTDRYPLVHPYIPDIAVTNLTANPNKTYIGQTVAITVFALNKGYENETFNVSIYANSTLIQTLTVTNLTSYGTSSSTYNWNTSLLTPAIYLIVAKADILPGEVEISDNTYNGSRIQLVRFNVDFNNDSVVDVCDLRKAAIYFGHVGDCQYDLNFDGIVNYEDLQIIAENFTKPP